MDLSLFSDFLHPTSDADGAQVPGLWFAQVTGREEDGDYTLEWLSGPVTAPSAPARAASFMAGAERGAFFPFEVGDEVVVGFINGHLDQPVILGALWSDVDAPPGIADTTDENTTRVIVSRAGHTLLFDDSPGQEKVALVAKPELGREDDAMKLEMDVAAQKVTLQFNAANKIELGPDGIKLTGVRIDLN